MTSHVVSKLYNNGVFITADRPLANAEYRYTLQVVVEGGGIETLGNFRQYGCLRTARAAARATKKYILPVYDSKKASM